MLVSLIKSVKNRLHCYHGIDKAKIDEEIAYTFNNSEKFEKLEQVAPQILEELNDNKNLKSEIIIYGNRIKFLETKILDLYVSYNLKDEAQMQIIFNQLIDKKLINQLKEDN